MRKLKDYVQEQRREDGQPLQDGKKNAGIPPKKALKYYMPVTADRQAAIDEKIKTVQGRIFGRPVNKIEIGTIRDVWVPYGYFVYDYEVGGGRGLFKAKRAGQVHIIYDMNERHCMQYDEKESGALPLKKKELSVEKRAFLKAAADRRGILRDVEDYVQMKIMYKTFGHKGEIKLVKQVDFYRPAVELEVFFKGRNRNIRFAYLDEYAVKSEHILGMKYRITH